MDDVRTGKPPRIAANATAADKLAQHTTRQRKRDISLISVILLRPAREVIPVATGLRFRSPKAGTLHDCLRRADSLGEEDEG